MSELWYVYVVRCARGALYCGVAKDVAARVARHNSGKGAKSVRALGLPVRLVGRSRGFGTKSQALKREARFKACDKATKEVLVNQYFEAVM